MGAVGLDYPFTGDDDQIIDALRPFSLDATDAPRRATVVWTVEGPKQSETFYGRRIEIESRPVGDYAVKVLVVDGDGSVIERGGGTLRARSVRRELRDLTDEDRDRWLDALATMWTVPGPEGRAKYSDARVRRADISPMNRGDAATATWIFLR